LFKEIVLQEWSQYIYLDSSGQFVVKMWQKDSEAQGQGAGLRAFMPLRPCALAPLCHKKYNFTPNSVDEGRYN